MSGYFDVRSSEADDELERDLLAGFLLPDLAAPVFEAAFLRGFRAVAVEDAAFFLVAILILFSFQCVVPDRGLPLPGARAGGVERVGRPWH